MGKVKISQMQHAGMRDITKQLQQNRALIPSKATTYLCHICLVVVESVVFN